MGSAFLQSWTSRGGRAQTLGLQQGSGQGLLVPLFPEYEVGARPLLLKS